MGDRVLVTGASGFVGQNLVRRLAEDGHDVVAMDIQQEPPVSYRHLVGDEVTYYHGSIIHFDFVNNVLFPTPQYYDRVFHLAAVVGVDRYVDSSEPIYAVKVNVNGTMNLLEQIRGSDTRFVYTSTSEVYGKNPELPWSEDHDQVFGPPTSPRWSYATAKSLCEHMIHMLCRTDREISASVARPFNLYGPYQRPKFVISKFVDMVLDSEVPTVYDDGTQSRCFTYIDDFVDGLVRASEHQHEESEVYNLGGTDEIQIGELAELIMELGGMGEKTPEYVSRDEVTGSDFDDIPRRVPDVSRAREQLDWEPTTSLRDGLEETIEWMRDSRID